MRRLSSFTFIAAALLMAAATPSFAQAPLEGGPATTTTTTTTTTAPAMGATHGTGIGVGVMVPLISPLSGASLAFDGGPWHAEGVLGMFKNGGGAPANRLSVIVGGRFWWHIHNTANSDFSLGGGLSYYHNGPSGNDGLLIDGGAQLRAFLTSNVAASFTVGLGIATVDYDQLGLGGNFIGTAGIHYYFF
jgi:hypothetical protein